MHLKRQGQYICRTLSYHGCSFHVDEHALSSDALRVYDEAARFWIDLYAQLQHNLKNGDLQYFQRAETTTKQKTRRKPRKSSPSVAKNSVAKENTKHKLTSGRDDSSSDGSDSESDCSSLDSDDFFCSTATSSDCDSEDDGDRNRGNGSLRVAENDKTAINSINRYFWGEYFFCCCWIVVWSLHPSKLQNHIWPSFFYSSKSFVLILSNQYLFLFSNHNRSAPAILSIPVYLLEGAARH